MANKPPPPVACSLDAVDLAGRRRLWGELCETALNASGELRDGIRLEFAARADVESRLRELIALEADCCRFASFRLEPSRARGVLVLDISAADELGAAAVRELFAA